MKNKIVLNLIIIILLITALLILGYIYYPIKSNDKLTNQNTNQIQANQNVNTQPSVKPTKEEGIATSDWKTYRNEEYGFEIRYPKEWIEINMTGEGIPLGHKLTDNNKPGTFEEHDIYLYENNLIVLYNMGNNAPFNLDISGYKNFNDFKKISPLVKYEVTYKDINVKNIPLYKIELNDPNIKQIIYIFKTQNNHFIVIGGDDYNQKYLDAAVSTVTVD